MIRLLLIIFITLPLSLLQSQSVLDRYVEEAINNNLSVKEKKLLEQRELYSLERAGKEAGPEVKLLTSYTLAAGGRTIELPIGDLLNDVYSSLENLTGNDVPRVENQSVDLLPNNFYDFRFRITQPILQPEIKYNKLIKQEEVTLAELQTDETIRNLTQQVKSAYIQWMRATESN